MEANKSYKGNIAFLYRNSWYHRKKELLPNGEIKYGRLGGFQTPEEAEQSYYTCLKQFEEQCMKEVKTINKEILFKDYLIYWFENIYSPRIESTTQMITSYTVYDIIVPNINYDIKLRLITTEYLNELLNKIAPYSKLAGNKARETLFIAFKDAIANGYIASNPVENTKKYRRPKTNMKILRKEELKKLLYVTQNGSWYLEILLAVFCGLRKGEILGLKFSDYNEEMQTIKINRQLSIEYSIKENEFTIESRKYKERNPKTENSYRTLRVPKVIAEEIQKRKLKIDYNKSELKDYVDNDYISCQKNGLPHSATSLNVYLNRICSKNGIGKITVHSLRHVFATTLMEQKVALPKISALLGHSSIHTTYDYYCDVMEEDDNILAYINNTFVVKEDENE